MILIRKLSDVLNKHSSLFDERRISVPYPISSIFFSLLYLLHFLLHLFPIGCHGEKLFQLFVVAGRTVEMPESVDDALIAFVLISL